MNQYIKNLNVIDLISEKHKELRRKTRDIWNDDSFCDNKLHLISMLHIKKMTISESARKMDISRQAVHKFSKTLVEKDLIKIEDNEENHKEKLMILTEKGEKLYKDLLEIKLKLENEIQDKIGLDNFIFLKEILQKEWL